MSSVGESRASSAARRRAWRFVLVALLAAAPYARLPWKPLLHDAPYAILDNAAVRSGPLARLFALDFWGMPLDAAHATHSYRPLVSLTWAIQSRVPGDLAVSCHLADVLLHASAAVLVLLLLESFGAAAPAALAGALLFALHPAATEAVSSAVGRADMLAAVALLGALLLHRRARTARRPWTWEAAALASVSAGFLCKEYAVSFPFVLLAHDLATGVPGLPPGERRRAGWFWLASFGLLAAYLALRWSLMGSLGGVPMLAQVDQPLLGEGWLVRWSTAAWLLVQAARLVLLPVALNHHYAPGALAVVRLPVEPRAIAGIVFVAALFAWAAWRLRRRRDPIPMVAAVLFAFPLGPALNTVSVAGVMFAEMWLYLPIAGAALMAAWALGRVPPRGAAPRVVAVVVLGVLVALGACAARRVEDWGSMERLARSSLRWYPDVPRVRLELGLASGHAGRHEEAAKAFREALDLEPRDPRSWKSYADALINLGRHSEAAAALRRAVDLTGGAAAPLCKELGRAEMAAGDPRAAVEALRRARALRGDDPEISRALGRALVASARAEAAEGRLEAAAAAAREAVALDALDPAGMFDAAMVLHRAGDESRARPLFERAVLLAPNLIRSLHDEAMDLEKGGRLEESADKLREILVATPEHVPTLFNLGRILFLAGKPADAIAPLEMGLKIRNDPRARALLESARKQAREAGH